MGVRVGTGTSALAALPALERALAGDGPAVRLVPGPVPPHALAPPDDDAADPTVVSVTSSGSSGEAKTVLLGRRALLSSADGTHRRLGGPGTWLLALPPYHVAGLQVLLRSLRAGTRPLAVDPGADPAAFAAAAEAVRGERRYGALVPTQLHRLLSAGSASVAALAGFDAVLVGGAAAEPRLVERARAAGVPVVTTYGMSETCGGCVYDGDPLDGVGVEVDGERRITLSGPVLARGYLGRPDLTAGAFGLRHGVRVLRTDDLGEWDGRRLVVIGRADDLVVTGARKVAPAAVEAVLVAHPAIAEACVVGLADEEWGEVVAALVVPAAGGPPPDLEELRSRVRGQLGGAAVPRVLQLAQALPLRGPGKPDRAAVRARLSTAGSR